MTLRWSVVLSAFVLLAFEGCVHCEDEIKRVQESRKNNPPAIQWQFPEDDYIFTESTPLVSFVVTNFWTPAAGKIVLEINSNRAGEWDTPPNEFGETRMHINLPEFPDGEHYVAAYLIDANGEPIGVEADATFHVDTKNSVERGKVHDAVTCTEDADACIDDSGCSGHGKCIRGACVCDAHWTGEQCDFDLFKLPRYHPDIDPMRSKSRCQKAKAWQSGLREFMRELRRINHPNECNKDTVMLFEAPSHGLGANLHYLTVAMTRCLQAGKAMVLKAPPHMPVWLYGWHDECEIKGHGCHFMPYTNCTGDEEKEDYDGAMVHPRNGEVFPPDSRYRPADYAHQGTLWYRSLIMHYLLQPNADLEANIRYHRNALQITHPIIGMHIRAGDACAHAATSTIRPECRPISRYIEELQLMARKYKVKRVFLACDDAKAADAVKTQSGLDVTMLDLDREKMFAGKWFIEYRMAYGATNTAQVAESTMIDLFLLRECDYFVGTFASQFSRLAFEMMVAYKGYVPPYSSVDYPWCFNYMEKMQLGMFGENFC